MELSTMEAQGYRPTQDHYNPIIQVKAGWAAPRRHDLNISNQLWGNKLGESDKGESVRGISWGN